MSRPRIKRNRGESGQPGRSLRGYAREAADLDSPEGEEARRWLAAKRIPMPWKGRER